MLCIVIGAIFVTTLPALAEPIHIGSRLEVLWDETLVDSRENVTFKLHEPRAAESVLRIDKPWEGTFNGPITVFEHNGTFHMYYRALTDDHALPEYTCYASSPDGITWTKPALGHVEAMGRKDTNIIVDESGEPINLTMMLDNHPDTPEDERIKGVRIGFGDGVVTPWDAGEGTKFVQVYTSADGTRFKRAAVQPQLASDLPNAFDAQNIIFWSEAEQAYCCYFRYMFDGKRSMARSTSKDFVTWTEPVRMAYSDTGSLSPSEQLYTHSTWPYFRAPHTYLSLPVRFMQGRRVLSDEQLAKMAVSEYRIPGRERPYTYYNDSSDISFMTTRAGSDRYERVRPEALVRPGLGNENWVSRTTYPFLGLLQTGPAELSFYVARHYTQPSWHVQRYTVRLDGFISLHADYEGGTFTTKPLVFSGQSLEINYSTGAAGDMRFELLDASGRPVPGFTAEDCDPVIGDHLARTVTWSGSDDVSPLAGKAVRLRVSMKEADLYSFRFVE
jgi:hypothetical protein